MARGKKKESALTPEEKLAQALVPVEKQPYRVPKNWIWSYIRSGYEVTSSKRVHKDDWLSEGVPFYRTRELVKLSEHGYVDNELFISEEQYEDFKTAYGVPQMGDLLISGVGTIGVPYIVNSEEKFYFKDGNIIWFRNKGLFLPKYIYFLYKSLFMDNQIHEMSSGTTVDTYTIINANNTMVPVPPFAEQQRIVERIEYLFAKLDEAKEKAQSVLDSFETRKAAILHKAFTGELTAQWRAEHSVTSEGWHDTTVENLFEVFSGKGFKEKEYSLSGIKLLRISNVTYDELVWEDTKYLPVEYLDTVPELVLQSGDIVMALNRPITNGKLKVSIVDDRESYILYQRVGCLRRRNPENSTQYLQYALLSQSFLRQVESHLQGSDQPYINLPPLKSLSITMCSECEQKEVVRILDSLFAKEQQAKEAAEAVLEKIDLLKKSILARAFRGELGTNDPSEESALELLKTIL